VAAPLHHKSIYKESGGTVYPAEYIFLQLKNLRTNYFEKGLSAEKIGEIS
jgi:hypothetical protein